MTPRRHAAGEFVQDCLNEGNETGGLLTLTGNSDGVWHEEGRISMPCAWGKYRDPVTPANNVLLDVHRRGENDYRLRVYRPSAGAESLDELAESVETLDPPVAYWEFIRENGENVESFLNVLRLLGETHRKRVAGLSDAEDTEHRAAAEELARGILLWRYGVSYTEDRADTSRAKGLWGELISLRYIETEWKIENASACWRSLGAKWDIEMDDDGRRYPIEVKTTTRNTHTHELRHSQLDEGRRCDLSLFSVRCTEDGSGSEPTLEELLRARRDAATLLGEKGSQCVERVDLELSRLSPKEKALRLRQEGIIVSIKVVDLPPFPNFPATYRDLKYTVALEYSGSPANAGSGSDPQSRVAEVVPGLAVPVSEPLTRGAGAPAAEELVTHEERADSSVQDHERAVEWAREHHGTNMTWQDIKLEGARLGIDLIIAPKGIHKPKGTQVVRAVRSSPESAYAEADEAGITGWWYSLEKPGPKKKSPPSKYTVHLVWVTRFDLATGRCLLSSIPAESPPAHTSPPDDPLLDLYTNRGLWQNYVSQIPLVYFEGF